jgi:hypothetical protein
MDPGVLDEMCGGFRPERLKRREVRPDGLLRCLEVCRTSIAQRLSDASR